jgi:hypothetical protein
VRLGSCDCAYQQYRDESDRQTPPTHSSRRFLFYKSIH